MNWLDIVLVVITAVSVLSGLRKGFAKVGIGLAASILGLLGAWWFYGMAWVYFQPFVQSKAAANLIGFLAIVVAFLIAGALLGWLVAKLLKLIKLSFLDRLAGGAFGALRALVLGVALIMGILAFSPTRPPASIVDSRVAPYFLDAARALTVMAPRELKDGVHDSYDKIKQAWRKAVEGETKPLPAEKF